MNQQQKLQPVELMRRVFEALVNRTLSFAFGETIASRVQPCQSPSFEKGRGLVINLTSLDGKRPGMWLMADDLWTQWLEIWKSSRKLGNETDAGKTLMLLLTGGLDRLQTVANPDPARALPSYPISSAYGTKDIMGWKKVSKSYFWFDVETRGQHSSIGLEKQLFANVANRMMREPLFRDLVKGDVLGEACGRLGAERPWLPSHLPELALGDDFVLGACLLPLEGRFYSANPNGVNIGEGELFLLHSFGWADKNFTVFYRCRTKADLKASYNRLFQKSHTLLPFAQLLGESPSADSWTFAKSQAGTTETFLHIKAGFEKTDEAWDVFVPSELLNELSKYGNLPWNINHLLSNADNLLQVFLCVIERFKLQPPLGLFRMSGQPWARAWFEQQLKSSPPPTGMCLADLWSVLTNSEKTILCQNILAVESELEPLLGLFSWSELDPQKGEVYYSPPGFDLKELLQLLPPKIVEEMNVAHFSPSMYDEYLTNNERALEIIWTSIKKRRISLNDTALEVLRQGFVLERKAWRVQKIRSWAGLPVANILEKARKDPLLVQILQKQGARNLALALHTDSEAARLVPSLSSKSFGSEFKEQLVFLAERNESEGPDVVEFESARANFEHDLLVLYNKYMTN